MNKIKLFIASIFLTVGLVGIASPSLVYAGPFDGATREACSGADLTKDGKCDSSAGGSVEGLIKAIINILTVVVGIAAVIVIIINGFRLVTSGGDATAVANARKGIIYAVVGLVIVAFAQFIVRFVIGKT